MIHKQTIKRHADLMDRMADATGVDLELAVMEGRLDMDELGDGVMACTGCANPDECEHWLTEQSGQTETTPDYCRNTDLLKRLRDGKKA